MQQVFRMRDADGEYDVPESEVANFKRASPNAVGVSGFRDKDGDYDVPDTERDNFKQVSPDAQPIRRFRMDDGEDIDVDERAIERLRQGQIRNPFAPIGTNREAERASVSRKAWKEAGLPEKYGRSQKERDEVSRLILDSYDKEQKEAEAARAAQAQSRQGWTDADEAQLRQMQKTQKDYAAMEIQRAAGADRPDLGVFGQKYLEAVAAAGRDVGEGELVMRQLPVLGAFIDASDAMVNHNFKRFMNGDFKDSLAMGNAARSMGIPEDVIADVQRRSWSGEKTAAGAPIVDQKKAAEEWMKVIKPLYEAREAAKGRSRETLEEAAPLTASQEILSGAITLPKMVADLTPLGFGATALPKLATHAESLMEKGDGEGTALAKSAASVGGEYFIWNKLGKVIEALPGVGGALKSAGQAIARSRLGGNVIARNAGQILEMNAKSGLTELVNDVVGMGKADGEEKKAFSDWFQDFISVPGNAKKMLMMLPAHLLMKGMGKGKQLLTKEGREAAGAVKAQRAVIESTIGEEAARGLSDADVQNIYNIVASPRLSEKSISDTLSFIEGKAGTENRQAALKELRKRLREGREQAESREAAEAGARQIHEQDMAERKDALEERREKAVRSIESRIENKAAREEKRTRKSEEAAEKARAEEEYRKAQAEQEAAIAEAARGKAADEAKPNAAVEEAKAAGSEAEQQAENPLKARLDAWPEYSAWLKKNGKKNNAKNWNKFVAQNDLDPNMKLETPDAAKKRVAEEFERGLAPDAELAAFNEYNEEYSSGKTKQTFDDWLANRGKTMRVEVPKEAPVQTNGKTPIRIDINKTAEQKAVEAAHAEREADIKAAFAADDAVRARAEKAIKEYEKQKRSAKTKLPFDKWLDKYLATSRVELPDEVKDAAKGLFARDVTNAQKTAKNAPKSAPTAEGTITPPKSADAPQGGKSPSGGAKPAEPPKVKPKSGFSLTSHESYDSDSESGSTGAVRWHHENGGRIYKIPVDVDATVANGGKVVLKGGDSATERIKELLNGRELRLTKGGKLEFKGQFNGGVPVELRPYFGRELEIGGNPDAPYSRQDMMGSGKSMAEGARDGADTGSTRTWADVENDVFADRKNYDAWKGRVQRNAARAKEEKALQKKIKSGKANETDLAALRKKWEIEDFLEQGGSEYSDDYLAMERDLEALQRGETPDDGFARSEVEAAERPPNYTEPTDNGGETLIDPVTGDVLYGKNPDGMEISTEAGTAPKPKTPEQEIIERVDLQRLDPKRRSDPKVIAWANKNGRTVTDGKVLPDAVREYDEELTRQSAKKAKRWFPDMKIVAHKYGEKIKRGQHVIDQLVDDEGIIKAFDNGDGTVTVYRAVQVNDKGEVRPPQSTRVQDASGKIADRPAEGYVDKEGNIRSANGGAVVIKAEERPDLAHRIKNKDGTWKKVTEKDVRDGRYPPEMLGADKWFFDLKKAKGTGSTDNVVYDPYMHSSDTPLNDQFTSAWKRPDWKIAVGRILKSDLESGYRADKAGLAVGAHEWKGGAVDNQLPKDMKRKVFLTQHLKMERILPEAEAARILKEKWGEMGLRLEIPDSRVSPAMREALIKEGFNVVKTGEVQYLRDTSGSTIGWFDPQSKEVHLLPGADPKTVAHEIMWHGTRDYISDLAAKGNVQAKKWLDMIHDVERNVPPALKRMVLKLYTKGTKAPPADVLRNEFGAWFTMGKGGKALEDALQTDSGRKWFAKGLYAVKEMYKDYLSRHGKNRVDLSAIDGMTRDQFVEFLAKEFAGGKTLGEIKGPQSAELSTEETKFQAARRKFYDQNAAIRDAEREAVEKKGQKISADDSVEVANALKHGLKEAANIELQGKLRDLSETLHKTGISRDDLESYAAYKAAAGRDAKIDARNIANMTADMKRKGKSASEIADAIANYRSTNGSHIDPREARMMLAEIEHGPMAKEFADAYKKLREIIDETLKVQEDAGLISHEDAEAWRNEEPNYIPFKNEYDPESGEWAGRGASRNYAAPEQRMAKGRKSAAGDIIAHIFMDHQSAKHRAIENAVRQKLAKFVKTNPELGKVELLDRDAKVNPEKDDPNVVVFKEDGRSYAIRLNGTRGAAIANAFTGRNTVGTKWADKGFSVFGKKFSYRNFALLSAGTATRLSPTFALRNTIKDNIEIANIVFSERGFKEGGKWLLQYAKLRAETLKNVANVLTGRKLGIDGDTLGAALGKYITTGKIDTSTKGGDILDRYIKAGGLIAGGVKAEAIHGIKERLDQKAIEKEIKSGKSKTRAVVRHIWNSVGYLNEYAEMASRVGAFATEVQSGKSDAEAALFSRRVTVDFNRKGDLTPATNLLRMFSNSMLGATARATAALARSKNVKRAALGTASAFFANGLAQAFVEYAMNRGDDKDREKTGEATGKDVSEYDRRTSLFYLRTGDKVYRVAQHESPFSLITYAGNCMGRWICGELKGADVAKNLGVSAAELAYNYLPLGQINLDAKEGGGVGDLKSAFVSGIVPSALQPIAELLADIDFKGDPIFRRKFDKYAPNAHNAKAHTPEWAKGAAEWLNERTGGDAGSQGWLDVAPEAIQHLAEGYGKNLLRDISTAYSFGEAIMKGELSSLDPRNTPLKRDFVRPLDGNTSRYYEAMDAYNRDRKHLLAMTGKWTPEQRRDFVKEHPWAADKDLNKIISSIDELQNYEAGKVKSGKNGHWTERKTPPTQEQVEAWKARRLKLQARFLEIAEKRGGER